jgi:hypothetical protein
MRVKRYDINVSILNSFFQAGRRDMEVIHNPLPDDAELVKIYVDPKMITPGIVTLFYTSISFPEITEGSIPEAERSLQVRTYNHIPRIKEAIRDYHYALDCREHGTVAAQNAINRIMNILEMPWLQGEEKKRREA